MISVFEWRVKLHSSVICSPRLNFNKAFGKKLTLFEIQLSRNCFIHFSRCEKYSQEAVSPISMLVWSRYHFRFENAVPVTFSYLDACSSKIRLLKNLFDSVIENLPPVTFSLSLHMEVIDLQSCDIFKDKFKEGNLIEILQMPSIWPICSFKKVYTWFHFSCGITD